MQIASWEEINTSWSVEDIEKANAVLEIKDAMEEILAPEPPPK